MSKTNSESNGSLNINAALGHFFKLPDVVTRMVSVSGVAIALILLFLLSLALFLIPVLGWAVGLVFLLALLIVSILLGMYVGGYQFEVIQAVASKIPLANLGIFNNYSQRISHGFRFAVAALAYSVPMILIYIIAFVVMFLLGASADTSTEVTTYQQDNVWADQAEPDTSVFMVVGIIVFYGGFFLAWIYQMILYLVWWPAMMVVYARKPTWSSLFSFARIWHCIKNNVSNILIHGAVLFGVGIVINILSTVVSVTVFLCIGIILYPAFLASAILYMAHVQGHMIGQMVNKSTSLE